MNHKLHHHIRRKLPWTWVLIITPGLILALLAIWKLTHAG
jgi:hypothetical protein